VLAVMKMGRDLSVCLSFRGQSCDLRLLRSELVERVDRPFAGALACRLELDPRPLGERVHPEVREEPVGDPELLACVQASAFPP
jgi:hypothetical protein